MSLISCNYRDWHWPVVLMILFSVMTPAGMLIGNIRFCSMDGVELVDHSICAGYRNFLHISTTIFMESSPGHRLD